jgi:DnaJ-class molecular chaperone
MKNPTLFDADALEPRVCPRCKGLGVDAETDEPCARCEGTGLVPGYDPQTAPFPEGY